MHHPLLKSPLYIVSLGTFTIFDMLLPFLCFGQQIASTTVDNHINPQHFDLVSPSIRNKDTNGSYRTQQLYVVTLTSDYIVTLTSTSYSYSSLTTTIQGSLLSPTSRPAAPTFLPSPSDTTSKSTSSSDTAILVGSIVGGITGILLIGIGILLFFRKKDRTADEPPSSLYMDPQDDYRPGGFKRTSYGRAFVPPLGDPSLSTPAASIATSNQYYQTHVSPYNNTSETLIHSYHQQEERAYNTHEDTRHIPDETDQPHGAERHVPHLVD